MLCQCRRCGQAGFIVHRATFFRHQAAERAAREKEALEDYQRRLEAIHDELVRVYFVVFIPSAQYILGRRLRDSR